MSPVNPLDLAENFMEAMNRGDLNAVLSYYEQDAILIAQPGKISKGRDEISTALEEFIALKPKLKSDSNKIISMGNLALFCSKWTLIGTSPDGKHIEIQGTSSDVFRQQSDGRWLVAIDNPWGTTIID